MNEQLKILFQRYFDGSATAEEVSELLKLLEDKEASKELPGLLTAAWQKLDQPDPAFAIPNRQRLLQIINTTQKTDTASIHKLTSRHRVHFLKTGWFRYAAAIIIILGAASYLWFGNAGTNSVNHGNSVNSDSDLPPGSNRAILTLANGQQIILDSTQGNIVKQGKLTVVNLAGQLNYQGTGTAAEYNTISTPKGGQYQIVLPDGTKVWLNAASSIHFPTMFVKDRVVHITGESYLEVAADKSKPFFVTLGNAQGNGPTIQVLGTSFNVNAYEDESTVKTTLLQGAIKIEGTVLKPGQAYIGGRVITANIEQDIAWKNGFFNLQDADLKTVMKQLERWYDIEVKYEGPLPEVKFKGGMDRGVHLSGVLRLLSQLDIKSRLEGKTLIVSKE